MRLNVVIGSRYVKGGRRKDPFQRKVFPIIGNFLYRNLLGSTVNDMTSGYRAYRKNILNKIDLDNLPNDFSFQAAILFELLSKNTKISEIPIKFKKRMYGKPKYSINDLLSNIKLLLTLFVKRIGMKIS